MYMYRDTHSTCKASINAPSSKVNPDTCTCIGIHTVPVKHQSMLLVPR